MRETKGHPTDQALTTLPAFLYLISFHTYNYQAMRETHCSPLYPEEETGSDEPVRGQDGGPNTLAPQPVGGMPYRRAHSPGLRAGLQLPAGRLTSRNPKGRAGQTRAV